MLKFAIIGCGRICKKHIQAIEALDEASLVAVCDIDAAKAETVAKENNVAAYTDYHDMLKNEDIDVVNILTPSGDHARHAIDVASYKKHVVVEKPMALTLDDADQMIRACDENAVKLFVVKQNRYNKPVVKLAEAVREGKFGKLVMGTVRVRWCRPQAYYDQDDWRGTWAMDGGVFTNQASHHIDLLEWLMGDVDSVFARSETQLVDIEVEDTGAALIKFRNGALGIIEATTATRPNDLEGSISILGEKGSVEIAGFAVNQMKTWRFEGELDQEQAIVEEYAQMPKDVYGFGHYAYMRDVCDSIMNNKKALVDGLEGRKSLELILAMYESIETGKDISMRFSPKRSRLGMAEKKVACE